MMNTRDKDTLSKITEHMRDIPRADVELLLHGDDGEPHGVAPQQADHVPQTSQHTEHIPTTAGFHPGFLSV